MKVGLQNLQYKGDETLVGWLRDLILRLRVAVDNTHLGFGDGTVVDNIYGAWANYTTNATPNTNDSVTHNLGVVPIGYIVVSLDKAAIVYTGSVSWTTTTISLKCNTASTAVRIFILGPSNQAF